MRVLISLFRLSFGGSHINAIEIGALLRKRGHDVIIYSPDGPLRERVEQLGLEYIDATDFRRHHPPTPRGTRRLNELVRERGIDLIHAYEWSATVEAAYGPHLTIGTPLLSTVYSTKVPRFVPRHLPMIVGYTNEVDIEHRRGRRDVHAVVCPVDTEENAPVLDARPARARFGLRDDELAAVIVSRLSPDLKREGLLSSIAAAELVGSSMNLRLIIVGGGPCQDEINAAAKAMNERVGREIVTLTGPMLDPRDAYAAADIVLGMGTSAQKGMAFAKPVVIQGEHGYWELLTPDSLPKYLRQNFYGLGDGSDGAPRLAAILDDLGKNRERWSDLGEFGRKTAISVFSNESAADQVLDIAADVLSRQGTAMRRAAGLLRTSGWFAGFRVVDSARHAIVRLRSA